MILMMTYRDARAFEADVEIVLACKFKNVNNERGMKAGHLATPNVRFLVVMECESFRS